MACPHTHSSGMPADNPTQSHLLHWNALAAAVMSPQNYTISAASRHCLAQRNSTAAAVPPVTQSPAGTLSCKALALAAEVCAPHCSSCAGRAAHQASHLASCCATEPLTGGSRRRHTMRTIAAGTGANRPTTRCCSPAGVAAHFTAPPAPHPGLLAQQPNHLPDC